MTMRKSVFHTHVCAHMYTTCSLSVGVLAICDVLLRAKLPAGEPLRMCRVVKWMPGRSRGRCLEQVAESQFVLKPPGLSMAFRELFPQIQGKEEEEAGLTSQGSL